jgi:heptosyltransferase-1
LNLATQAPPRILIVKLSSLGDVVHAMAAVQDIRRAYPSALIDWVVERAFAPLVARCEGVQRVIPCELRRWRKSIFSAQTRQEWAAFKAELQAQPYDAVIDLQGLTKSALVSWLAQTRVGGLRYSMANQTDGSSFEAPARWLADVAIHQEPHVHAVERARILCAKALDYELQGPAVFGLRAGTLAVAQPKARAAHKLLANPGAAANPFAPRKPVVALVHGTSRKDKEWPLESWVELGQRLNHSGFCVALAHGNAAEKAISDKIAAELADAWVWPTMALDALTDTMARCAGVIGVDSGLSHIAVALDLPHVQIYNFDTAWRTGVDSARQVSVYASPAPDVCSVWQAWEGLDTPVLCH